MQGWTRAWEAEGQEGGEGKKGRKEKMEGRDQKNDKKGINTENRKKQRGEMKDEE